MKSAAYKAGNTKKTGRKHRMYTVGHNRTTLKVGASSLSIVAAMMWAPAALAQSSDSPAQLDEVVVTGTSIRGEAPVGSNLISVDRAEIAKQSAPNVTQVLTTIPSLSNMGVAGRGGNGNGGNGAAV